MSGIERILYSEHVYWGRLFDDFPDYQFVLYGAEQQEVVAEGHTAPCRWDETADGLGDGVDAMIAAASRRPTEATSPTRCVRWRRRSDRPSRVAAWPTGSSTRWPGWPGGTA